MALPGNEFAKIVFQFAEPRSSQISDTPRDLRAITPEPHQISK